MTGNWSCHLPNLPFSWAHWGHISRLSSWLKPTGWKKEKLRVMQFPTRAWNQVSQASFKVGNCFKTSDKFRTGKSVWWMSEIYFFLQCIVKILMGIWLTKQSNPAGVWHLGFTSSQSRSLLLKLFGFTNLIISLKAGLTWEGFRIWSPPKRWNLEHILAVSTKVLIYSYMT